MPREPNAMEFSTEYAQERLKQGLPGAYIVTTYLSPMYAQSLAHNEVIYRDRHDRVVLVPKQKEARSCLTQWKPASLVRKSRS